MVLLCTLLAAVAAPPVSALTAAEPASSDAGAVLAAPDGHTEAGPIGKRVCRWWAYLVTGLATYTVPGLWDFNYQLCLQVIWKEGASNPSSRPPTSPSRRIGRRRVS